MDSAVAVFEMAADGGQRGNSQARGNVGSETGGQRIELALAIAGHGGGPAALGLGEKPQGGATAQLPREPCAVQIL